MKATRLLFHLQKVGCVWVAAALVSSPGNAQAQVRVPESNNFQNGGSTFVLIHLHGDPPNSHPARLTVTDSLFIYDGMGRDKRNSLSVPVEDLVKIDPRLDWGRLNLTIKDPDNPKKVIHLNFYDTEVDIRSKVEGVPATIPVSPASRQNIERVRDALLQAVNGAAARRREEQLEKQRHQEAELEAERRDDIPVIERQETAHEMLLTHHHPGRLHAAKLTLRGDSLSYQPLDSCSSKPFTVPLEGIVSIQTEGNQRDESYLVITVSLDGKERTYRFAHENAKLVSVDKTTGGGLISYRGLVMEAPPAAGSELARIKSDIEDAIHQRKTLIAQEQRRQEEREATPAGLIATVQYDDSQSFLPNQRLEPGKRAELNLKLDNHGPGPAYGVNLVLSADQPDVKLPASQFIGDIPVGATRLVRVPIEAGLELRGGELNVLVETKEKRGYDAQKVKLVIPTVTLQKPVLSIESYEINGIPESGQTVELFAFVRNTGDGPAASVVLSAIKVEPHISLSEETVSLGTIRPNQSVRGKLVLAIPRTFSEKRLILGLHVADARGETIGAGSREITLNIGTRIPIVYVNMRVISQGRELQELTNGDTVELELAPENRGSLDAEDVSLQVSAPGVPFERDTARIGVLHAGEKQAPLRFPFTIPRIEAREKIPVRIQISQKEFPASSVQRELSVKRHQPALNYSYSILESRTERVLQQNQTSTLEVQVLNAGDLPAEEVLAKIAISTPGVQLQGSNEVRMGTIRPNEKRIASFRVHLLRSVPAGDLPVQLALTQSDFASIRETLRLEVRGEQTAEVTITPAMERPRTIGRTVPVVALASPRDGEFVHGSKIDLKGLVRDERGISQINVAVNGGPVPQETVRQGTHRGPPIPGRDEADLDIPLTLDPGENVITVTAYNADNERESMTRRVTRLEDRPTIAGSQPVLTPQSDVDDYVLKLSPHQSDEHRWAVIIGIEDYRKVPPALFAVRDALAMQEYATRMLGVPAKHVSSLLNDAATKAEIQDVLEAQLHDLVQPEDVVYVYFAGHGIPETKDRAPYLLPADGKPQSLRTTAYSLQDFYAALARLKAKRVIVFLDVCFSGWRARAEGLDSLLPGTRPAYLPVETPTPAGNVISLTATDQGQVSNAWLKQAHGLFTYFLLKGMSELGGARQDQLSLSELSAYVTKQVNQKSRELFGENQRQTPVLQGRIQPDVLLPMTK